MTSVNQFNEFCIALLAIFKEIGPNIISCMYSVRVQLYQRYSFTELYKRK